MTITFEPLLPAIAWVSLTVAAALVWIWYAMKRPATCNRTTWFSIVALMSVSMAIILVILLNPVWLKPLPPPAGKPLLTILVDSSRSMATEDAKQNQSRYELASEIAEETKRKLQTQFDVRLQSFSQQMMPESSESLKNQKPEGDRTDLAGPVLESLASDRPQGQAILLISDGLHNTGNSVDRVLEAAEAAKTWETAIYTVPIGGDVAINDLDLQLPRSQELAFVGQTVPISVEITQRGVVGKRVNLQLVRPDGQVIDKQVPLVANGKTTETFQVTPKGTGVFRYQVRTEALPREATSANNSATLQLRVIDKPVKALILEGKPYWDNRFLLRMLTNDPFLEVDCVVRISSERYLHRKLQLVNEVGKPTNKNEESSTRFQRSERVDFIDETPDFLNDPQFLDDYQILLLGREAESYLNETVVENIRNWAARGGGSMVCYRGAPVAEPNQKLARLLPVSWANRMAASKIEEARFRIQVTDRGNDLTWLRIGGNEDISKLPSLAANSAADKLKPLAIVLGRSGSNTSAAPAITYQPYGTGKVVVIEGAGMWRWAFLAPEYKELDAVYDTLWQSLLRWLVSSGGLLPGEDIALTMDRVRYTEGEAAVATILRNPSQDVGELPDVELADETGRVLQSLQPMPVGEEPGVFQIFMGILAPGQYEARLVNSDQYVGRSKSVTFEVVPDIRETLEVSANSALMERIAEITGGSVLTPANATTLAKEFKQHLDQTRQVQYSRITGWDRWWILVSILIIWSMTWGLRRRCGLI